MPETRTIHLRTVHRALDADERATLRTSTRDADITRYALDTSSYGLGQVDWYDLLCDHFDLAAIHVEHELTALYMFAPDGTFNPSMLDGINLEDGMTDCLVDGGVTSNQHGSRTLLEMSISYDPGPYPLYNTGPYENAGDAAADMLQTFGSNDTRLLLLPWLVAASRGGLDPNAPLPAAAGNVGPDSIAWRTLLNWFDIPMSYGAALYRTDRQRGRVGDLCACAAQIENENAHERHAQQHRWELARARRNVEHAGGFENIDLLIERSMNSGSRTRGRDTAQLLHDVHRIIAADDSPEAADAALADVVRRWRTNRLLMTNLRQRRLTRE